MTMAEDEVAVKTEQSEKAEEPKRKTAARRKAAPKRKENLKFVKSKRKSAVARASAKPGTGRIRVNSVDINAIEPVAMRRLMLEPVNVSPVTHDQARRMDITINVQGGGQSSQAQAVRGAIAKSIVESSGDDSIRKEYLRYDRFMLIDDTRRVEPKKFKGPKARARFQKSYR